MAIYHLHQKKFENVSKGGFSSKASKKAAKFDQGKRSMSSGLSTVTQTAGVKTVHGKGKKKADPSATRESQGDKLEDWTSDDGPSWMREPLDFSGLSMSHGNYPRVQDEYLPSYWDEL